MKGQRERETIDPDVVSLLEEFIKFGRDESPLDCLNVDDDPLTFSERRNVKYRGKDLVVERGDVVLTGGGAAIVIQCHEDEYDREYALKLPRPSVIGGDDETLQQIREELGENRAEAAKQGRLSHPNVAYLVDAEKTGLPVEDFRPEGTIMLQEWIEEARGLDEYIYSEKCDELDTLARLLRDVFRGLSHVHEKDLIHWDVKADNCLVDSATGTVKIADVGNACEKREPGTVAENTERFTSGKCWPSDAGDGVDEYEGSNRMKVTRRAGQQHFDRPWLDLYMAGRMMARICGLESAAGILGADDGDAGQSRPEVLDGDDDHTKMVRDFLTIVIRRLLTPFEDGVTDDPDPYYESADEVATDLGKLLHEFGAATDVPELYPIPQQTIRMPVTGNTEFSTRIERLTNLPPAKRLTGHEQLGLTRFVYPGGRHSRFEHLVGTVGTTLQYVRALYADRTNPAFRLLCDSFHVRALIFASAVHDMGHGAFSHYLEENEAVFGDCSHEDFIQAVLRDEPEEYGGYVADSLDAEGHLERDRRVLRERVGEDWVRTEAPNEEDPGEFMELVADVLRPRWSGDVDLDPDPTENGRIDFDPDLTDRDESELAAVWILHSVIDSVLDADKLDYLRRDAEHAGLDYPKGADVDRFFQSLTVALRPPSNDADEDRGFRPTIAVNQKGVDSLESLLLSRYQVFKSMYWHRTARSATTLLKHLTMQYLALDGESDGAISERRAELLERFREQDDDAALRWLLGELEDADEDVSRYRGALVRREGLPKPIFDVSQGEVQPKFERNSRYYDLCEQIMAAHDRLNELDPADHLQARKEVRRTTRSKLVDALETYRADQVEQATIETDLPEMPELRPDSLFIDVPLAGKDQIRNLYVVDQGGTLRTDEGMQVSLDRTDWGPDHENLARPGGTGHEVRPFDKFSPMADEVKVGFKHWARRIRVFTWSDDGSSDDPLERNERARILECVGNDKGDLAELVLESLAEAYGEVENERTS